MCTTGLRDRSLCSVRSVAARVTPAAGRTAVVRVLRTHLLAAHPARRGEVTRRRRRLFHALTLRATRDRITQRRTVRFSVARTFALPRALYGELVRFPSERVMGGRVRRRSIGSRHNRFPAATDSHPGVDHACSNRPGGSAKAGPTSSTSPLDASANTPPVTLRLSGSP